MIETIIFEGTHSCHFSITIIRVEMVYLFTYGCNIDHRYEKSRSNVGDIFEQTITSFVTLQLFRSK